MCIVRFVRIGDLVFVYIVTVLRPM